VVFDKSGMALYFSRSTIPFNRDTAITAVDLEREAWYRHLGIYAYRARTLRAFTTWPVANLERLEKLEQLRALYQGVRIHVEPACAAVPGGVDTQADLDKVNRLLSP
jgi:3-deoxy-manno-octulosonate cytidylyltransferase (CMP-KDO synthetase)